MKINDLIDDDYEEEEALPEVEDKAVNLDARRRLEDYREKRELERLLNDEFDYLDDIA
ncbi:MAG: hypothetical protein OEX07_03955 [Gammaproteobacteria bacterium]|nr:hypothetical protein [Gammaproteobacteria bacterium]